MSKPKTEPPAPTPPTLLLRVRTYADPAAWQSAWLIRKDGAGAESGLMHGRHPAHVVAGLIAWAEALGLTVEQEQCGFEGEGEQG